MLSLPVLCFGSCDASHLMNFMEITLLHHLHHASVSLFVKEGACSVWKEGAGAVSNLSLKSETPECGGTPSYWLGRLCDLCFWQCYRTCPFAKPQRVSCKAFYHLDPVRADLSPRKILITHRAFNSLERQERQYSAAGYFFLSLSPSHWVSVCKKKKKKAENWPLARKTV